MRILLAIPHFFRPVDVNATNRSHRPDAREERLRALTATICALRQTFGAGIYGLDHFNRVAWQAAPSVPHELDIVVCTTGDAHLLDGTTSLAGLFRHHPTSADPTMLGFECHQLFRDMRGKYDYYGYIEDDVVITDPLFFRKRRLFDRSFGPKALLQPNRYELRADGPVGKLYVDYHLRPDLTSSYQDISDVPLLHLPFADETITFERTAYPSAGCFFLDAEQLALWADGSHFLDGDTSYLSALDSAVTLSVMKQFRIYKPVLDQAWFLEVLHASPRWIPSVERLVQLFPRHTPFSPVRFPPGGG
jgi:hypothetical protein